MEIDDPAASVKHSYDDRFGTLGKNYKKTASILLHVRRKGEAVESTQIHEWILVNADGTNPRKLFTSDALFDPICVVYGPHLYVVGGHRIEGETDKPILTNNVHCLRLRLLKPSSQWVGFQLPFYCSGTRTAVAGCFIYLFPDYFPHLPVNLNSPEISSGSNWAYVYDIILQKVNASLNPPYLSPEGHPPKVEYCVALNDGRVLVWFLSPGPESTVFSHHCNENKWETCSGFSPPIGHSIVSHAVSVKKLYLFSTCWATPFLSGYDINKGFQLLFKLEIKELRNPLSERDESGFPLQKFMRAQLVLLRPSVLCLLGHWSRGEKEGSFFSITISVYNKPTPTLTVMEEKEINLVAEEVINFIPMRMMPSLPEDMEHKKWLDFDSSGSTPISLKDATKYKGAEFFVPSDPLQKIDKGKSILSIQNEAKKSKVCKDTSIDPQEGRNESNYDPSTISKTQRRPGSLVDPTRRKHRSWFNPPAEEKRDSFNDDESGKNI